MRLALVLMTLVCFPRAMSVAGVGTVTAVGWSPSPQDNFCVVVARVHSIAIGDMGADKPHVLELDVLAVRRSNRARNADGGEQHAEEPQVATPLWSL